ncbi:MAG: hypothetical protein Kow00109_28570 [Acidobacteriota bacterium]
MKVRWLAVLALVFTTGCAVHPIREVRVQQPIGDSTLYTHLYRTPRGTLLFLNLHEDEATSVAAALRLVRRHGGRIVKLEHSGERLLTFELDGRTYRVDPNRIFTPSGVRATLERYSHPDPEAAEAALAFARHLVASFGLTRADIIVTLHNNGEGGYAATSYLPGGEMEREAARVHLQPGTDPDDFFFVTTPELFEAVRARGCNVVLQDNAAATDDGSLSVLAARLGVPYVNVEAQHGHLKEQLRMLRILLEVLD